MTNGYSKKILSSLKKKKIAVGDTIKIISGKNTHKGLLMPKAIGNPDVLVIKLKSGYNIGKDFSNIKKIEKIKSLERKSEKMEKLEFNTTKPKATMIITGGTISSKVDYKTGGVSALISPNELLSAVPELKDIVNLEITSPFTRMSESINYQDWQEMAKAIEKAIKKSDGVILTQGTDSLAYTAAALSFMLPNCTKPVVIVGSQRSSDRGSSDAAFNLICASHLIAKAKELEIRGVGVCMHSSINDDFCFFLKGTKVRKMHSSRRDAFRPINAKPIAKIWPDGKIEIVEKLPSVNGKCKADTKFFPKVALVKFTPGSSPEILDFYTKKGYKGIIIEALGLGQISTARWTRNKKDAWVPALKKAIKKGVTVCIVSQTIYGRVNSKVYSEAREIHDAGAIFLRSTLSETAWIKLGWVLGHTKDPKKIRELMLTNLVGELSTRTEIDKFLV
jgi:glutamyl-tRNA(Gln) amidotransferase subunit D